MLQPRAHISELVIATRRSPLALWQAKHVQDLLRQRGIPSRLLLVTTTGDRILDQALDKVGGKGLFLKEIELALVERRADLAVHSLKDVPMRMAAPFALAAVLAREDPRDALVARGGVRLKDLPAGATVGTSSQRRSMMIGALRPDLQVQFIRGNVEGRLAKLEQGGFDAIVLALAGLRRLSMEERATEVFATSEMLPAVGQGAIGVEILSGRADLQPLLQPLDHQPTRLCVTAERSVGFAMGASCSEAFAAHAHLADGSMDLRASWGGPDGAVSTRVTGAVATAADAHRLGLLAAAGLGRTAEPV